MIDNCFDKASNETITTDKNGSCKLLYISLLSLFEFYDKLN